MDTITAIRISTINDNAQHRAHLLPTYLHPELHSKYEAIHKSADKADIYNLFDSYYPDNERIYDVEVVTCYEIFKTWGTPGTPGVVDVILTDVIGRLFDSFPPDMSRAELLKLCETVEVGNQLFAYANITMSIGEHNANITYSLVHVLNQLEANYKRVIKREARRMLDDKLQDIKDHMDDIIIEHFGEHE